MTVAGTVSTLRVTGVPSGYPAEQEANVKVRWIDSALEVMSDFDVPLLKAIGGIDQFTATNTKFEWVLKDLWTDRGTLGAQLTSGGVTLTWSSAISHRVPRGVVLKCEDELIWVSAQASTTTTTVVRGYAGTADVTHANGTEVRIVGFSEVEGKSITYRGSALRTVPYNFFSIYKMGQKESWMQTEASVYTRSGATMPEMMADDISQIMVMLEAQIIEGERYEGTGEEDPPFSGGLRFFGTTANGATVVDCSGAQLSRDHLNTGFDGSFNQVGRGKMARTVLGGVGVHRRLQEIYLRSAVRTDTSNTGITEMFNRMTNEYGEFNFLGPFKRIPVDELWIVNTASIQVGKFGQLGRLHEFDIATDGDFNAKGIYGAYGNKLKAIPGIIRVHNFTL